MFANMMVMYHHKYDDDNESIKPRTFKYQSNN